MCVRYVRSSNLSTVGFGVWMPLRKARVASGGATSSPYAIMLDSRSFSLLYTPPGGGEVSFLFFVHSHIMLFHYYFDNY